MIRYKKRVNWHGRQRSITLTPSDHALLLRRFDSQNAKKLMWGNWEIDIPCPLCEKFLSDDIGCSPKCPFDKFTLHGVSDPTGGCRELWRGQKHDIEPTIEIRRCITWSLANHEQAKLELKSIRDWLKSFKRVTV